MKVSKQWKVIGGYSVADTNESATELMYGGCGCCGGGPDESILEEPVARLMAAAPEMLNLLRQLDKYGQDSVDTTELLDRLKDIEFTEA